MVGIAFQLPRGFFGDFVRQHPQRLAGLQRADIGFGGTFEIIHAVEGFRDRVARGKQAEVVAERIRAYIETAVADAESNCQITVSIGCTQISDEEDLAQALGQGPGEVHHVFRDLHPHGEDGKVEAFFME